MKGCLAENGVHLTPVELDVFFTSVSQNQATVNYLDLIAFCRGQMSKQREGEVERLFNRLDQRKTQEISTDALLKRFKPQNHPEVASHRQSVAAVQSALVDSLTLFGKLGGYDLQNGLIKFDEFLEFFDGLSSLEHDDKNFISFVKDCFA